jgi:hypothetical protein
MDFFCGNGFLLNFSSLFLDKQSKAWFCGLEFNYAIRKGIDGLLAWK